MTRIGINGFGRIGRLVFKAALATPGVEVAGINDLVGVADLAHLLAHDSVYGRHDGEVEAAGDALMVDGVRVRVAAERDPAAIPWAAWDAPYVVESTGVFRSREGAAKHLAGGARRVVVSAPGQGVDGTFVMGVNHEDYDPARHEVVSNASCTTNCLAPVAKVLHESCGVERALMTTIHAYTSDQSLVDGPHKDPRRARAAALNMIPTSTGAAKAIGLVMPELAGLVDGMSVRLPTPTVSLVDLVAQVARPPADGAAVNAALAQAAAGPLAGILGVEERPLVSSDFRGDRRSSVVDAPSTAVNGSLVKVLAWYDNEAGYAARVVDLVAHMASLEA